MTQVTLTISGMSCGGCVGAVRNVLGRVQGVREAEVVVGSARVSFDETQATEADLRDAIGKAGFEVNGVSETA